MTPVAAIALSGMTAATARLAASASNVANMNEVSAPGAPGYQPVGVETAAQPGGGVAAQTVTLKPASFLAYDPISPVASAQGYVAAPEIDPISEISNQLQARQAYAFSAAIMKVADETQQSVLNIQS